ncbi:MAG: VOC family protein [bacterium]|nr:VOC family protein [bacterium]
MSNRVVHFEIQADDTARAMKFYTDVFGWEFQQWEQNQYWMVMTAPKDSKEPGINGGLQPRPAPRPAQGQGTNAYVCTVQVDNIDETIKKIEAGGGIVALPKFAFPGMAWQAYYLDTEGNTFGIHQPDVNAK